MLISTILVFNSHRTVIQVGLPANPEQYIHRLGRTARAGASGSGILILAPFETFFLRKREIVSLSVTPHPASNTSIAESMLMARATVEKAMMSVEDEIKAQYYSASLGFYNHSLGIPLDQPRLW